MVLELLYSFFYYRATLSNIFGTAMVQPQSSDQNTSLKYVPPKQPDRSKSMESVERKKDLHNVAQSTAAKATLNCLVAKAVFAHQLVNQSYTLKGKFGCALVKSSNPLKFNLILYNAQKKTMSSSKITEHFVLVIQGNKYISFYDDLQVNWSVMFSNSQDYDEFINVCKSNNVSMKNQTPASSETSVISLTISETSDNTLTTVSEEQNTEDSAKPQKELEELDKIEPPVKDDKLKSDIVNRMAKMGQAILLPRQIPTETISDSSELDSDESRNRERLKPQIPQKYKSVKPSPVTRKSLANKSKTDIDTNVNSTTNMGIVPMSSNTVLPSGTYFTLINGQLVPVSPSGDQIVSTQYLQRPNTYLNEIPRHDPEITSTLSNLTANLVKLTEKIENMKEEKTNFIPSAISEKSFEFTTDVYKKLLLEYESKIAMKDKEIEKLQNSTEINAKNSSTHKLEVIKSANEEECHCNKSNERNRGYIKKITDLETELIRKNEDNLKIISDLNEKLQKKHEEYVLKENENNDYIKRIKDLEAELIINKDKYIVKENEWKETSQEMLRTSNSEIDTFKEIEQINSDLSFVNETLQSRVKLLEEENEIIRLESNDKRIGDSEFEMKIKIFMNETYKNLISQFESEEAYSASNVKTVIGNTIKETTLSLLEDK